MAGFGFNRKRAQLKQLLGIRARLALLALILVAPLMLERVRWLEDNRARQIAAASTELGSIARHSADAQREVISSVETLLKSAAFIRASAGGVGRSCDMLRASLPDNLPWIRTMMIAGSSGRIQCSTNSLYVGLDLSETAYFRKAQASRDFVFSNFQIGPHNQPIMMAAYPVSAISEDGDAVVLASVNLEWMSKLMSSLGSRPGVSAVLIDATGVVLAVPPDQKSLVGRPIHTVPALRDVIVSLLTSDQNDTPVFRPVGDGTRKAFAQARIAGTATRLLVSIDEAKVTAGFDSEIRNAYLQTALVCLLVLLAALVAAGKLIIQPIDILTAMARRFGQGDLSARAGRNRLPPEFVPLAQAFNTMAAQLAERELQLVAANDRLTVIASIDMLSGLANRRGFQGRLDFEWLKAQQNDSELALLMIDVDHFKLYNDSYGHPEGDCCLARVAEALQRIANASKGFAGRYGGEEFCLLLPDRDAAQAREIGERVRQAVGDLEIPHATSDYGRVTVSIGVASTRPNGDASCSELIEAADAALYAAKHQGRNAVVAHGFVAAPPIGDAAEDPGAILQEARFRLSTR